MTRLHSSARLLTICPRGCLAGEVSTQGGVCPGGVCPRGCLPRGVSAQGGVCPRVRWGCLPGGCLPRAVSARGGSATNQPPWTEFLSHASENITLQAVKIYTCQLAFVSRVFRAQMTAYFLATSETKFSLVKINNSSTTRMLNLKIFETFSLQWPSESRTIALVPNFSIPFRMNCKNYAPDCCFPHQLCMVDTFADIDMKGQCRDTMRL